jgi:hypothetical protein
MRGGDLLPINHDTWIPTALALPSGELPPLPVGAGDDDKELAYRVILAAARLVQPTAVLAVTGDFTAVACLSLGHRTNRLLSGVGPLINLGARLRDQLPERGFDLIYLDGPVEGDLGAAVRVLSIVGWLLVAGQDHDSAVRGRLLGFLQGLRSYSLYARAGGGLTLVRPAREA